MSHLTRHSRENLKILRLLIAPSFIDFLSNDSKIFSGTHEETTEMTDKSEEQTNGKNISSIILESEKQVNPLEILKLIEKTSEDDSPDNLSKEDIQRVTFQRYWKKRQIAGKIDIYLFISPMQH